MPYQRRPVLRNVAILTGGNLLERLLGAAYRIVLARAAGAEALGLIQFCLPILRLTLILGTLGLPATLTRVVAKALARKDQEEARESLAWSLRTVTVLGFVLALALLVLAPAGRFFFPDPRVVPLLRWLAPILFCDCLALVLQANLQGQNRMWPIALAGLVGQVGKLAIGVALIRHFAPGGSGAAASAALAAMAASEACALLLLIGQTGRVDMGAPTPKVERRSLLLSALPLMGDGLVFAVAGTIDVLVIPGRLIRAGLGQGQIAVLMGQVWGMALPTLFLPMVAIWPVAAATLPVIASAAAKGDRAGLKRRILRTYAVVAGVAVFTTLILRLFARPIMAGLYACPEAAPYLERLAWAVCPIYLASIGATFLTGLGRTALLFRQSLFCATLRVFLIYILTGLPHLRLTGAIIGIALGNGLLALANGWGIYRCLRRGSEPPSAFPDVRVSKSELTPLSPSLPRKRGGQTPR